MVIKGQLSATEQMKKFDDIQESHMVCLWECGGERGQCVYPSRAHLEGNTNIYMYSVMYTKLPHTTLQLFTM